MIGNLPVVKLGIVAVSRDCFPSVLSIGRCKAVAEACRAKGLTIAETKTYVENEKDVMAALKELRDAEVNALVVYLGNFGPEGPETMLAQKFGGPCMFVAAAEESSDTMFDGRGDAYCGMLNASYSLKLRGIRAYIPEYPVGTADEVASMICDFNVIARIVLGVHSLKIFGFGPRPYDFVACNAPIKQLFDLGVEVQENSELDLLASFHEHANDPRISAITEEMVAELGTKGNTYPTVLPKLAQYELTLLDWMEQNLGASQHAVFANKCWPAFQTQFGFVPCYVNARMAARGIPVACETDLYGALSEYMLQCASGSDATLLDINNTVPRDMYETNQVDGYTHRDLFMGFHCGNTSKNLVKCGAVRHQLIMKRSLEPDCEPNITRGTYEGTLNDGNVTLFRLQGAADGTLRSYTAQGEVLDIDPKTFGSVGVIGIPEMGRFYRHVLIQQGFPHHAGLTSGHVGKWLYEALKLLGVEYRYFNQPKGMLYPTENPFER